MLYMKVNRDFLKICSEENINFWIPIYDKVKEMFDERFIRMWSMYLCSCAATFNNGIIDLHQIVFY